MDVQNVAQACSGGSSSSQYTCTNQGISACWADVYGSGLDGQWIDITCVKKGNYTLKVEINHGRVLHESSEMGDPYMDNTYELPVTI
jgi:hypothetical protein